MKKLWKILKWVGAYIVSWYLLCYVTVHYIARSGYSEAGMAMGGLIAVFFITIGLLALFIIIGLVLYLIKNRKNGFNFKNLVSIAVIFSIVVLTCVFIYKRDMSVLNEKLWYAVEGGRSAEVKKLLQSGADANDVSASYRIPFLMQATIDNKLDIAEMLIAHGANVNAKLKFGSGMTALMRASSPALVKLLLSHGADVNARTDYDGSTAVMLASNPKVISLFIQHGADLNIKNKEGKTARMILLEKGYFKNISKKKE